MSIKEYYPDGVCPDCGEPIPDNAQEGESCENCDHVFYRYVDDMDFYDYDDVEEDNIINDDENY